MTVPKFTRIGREDDELVANYVHIERMSDTHIWANIGGESFDLFVRRGKLMWIPQSGKWPIGKKERVK